MFRKKQGRHKRHGRGRQAGKGKHNCPAPATASQPTVNDMGPGEHARIKQIQACMSIRQRLMDMGITEGVDVEMVRPAPLGDPVEIRVRNSLIALRRAEAQRLIVEQDGDNDSTQ